MLIYDWWFRQSVTEENMNDAFGAVQTADHNLMTDQQLVGVAFGGTVAQTAPTANLSVAVAETYAYDQLGQRIFTAGDSVDCSQDYNHVSTAVVGAGNEKWLSLFILFERNLSDPVIDGNGFTVYYVQAESYEYQVVQGAEAPAGTATRPALINPGLLLADVLLVYGQTQILTADILQAPTSTLDGKTGRMANTFSIVQSPFSVIAGNVPAAIAAMLTDLNEHVNGTSGEHPATAITAGAVSGTPFSLSSGTVATQVAALLALDNELAVAIGSLSANRQLLTYSSISSQTGTITGTGVAQAVSGWAMTFSGCQAGDILEFETDILYQWTQRTSASWQIQFNAAGAFGPVASSPELGLFWTDTTDNSGTSRFLHGTPIYVVQAGDAAVITIEGYGVVSGAATTGTNFINALQTIGRHYR